MVSTYPALVVALVSLLPGASCTFAYKRVVGSFGVSSSDRLVRLLAASGVFAALLAGPGLVLYQDHVRTGELGRGEGSAWGVGGLAIVYVLVPIGVGILLGTGQDNG